jgi:hypothetical protein
MPVLNPGLNRSLKNWLVKVGWADRRRDGRVPVRNLEVSYRTESAWKQARIRDISATGVYLLTDERWTPGTVVGLTLYRKGQLGKDTKSQVTFQAKAVRWGDDGVGLSFVPEDMDPGLWVRHMARAEGLAQRNDVIDRFRIVLATAFLIRICPSDQDQILQLTGTGLSSARVASAVEIALKAEELVASRGDTRKMRAPPRVVLRILEEGSRTDQDWIQQFWAGLLAASCTEDGGDVSSLSYVDLFSQLAPVHVRILVAACARASQTVSETGAIVRPSFLCTAAEIRKISEMRDIFRIERDLKYLSDLGLLEKTVKLSSFLPIDRANITPTNLALQLFKRWDGNQHPAQTFRDDLQPTH